MKRIEYQPSGVCSSKMIIELDGNIIQHIEIIGGCPGNTEAVSRLCVGRRVDEVVSMLSGIDCRDRGTSCPDQLAKALSQIFVNE